MYADRFTDSSKRSALDYPRTGTVRVHVVGSSFDYWYDGHMALGMRGTRLAELVKCQKTRIHLRTFEPALDHEAIVWNV